MMPTRLFGWVRSVMNAKLSLAGCVPVLASAMPTASVKEPNSAVAASTAVAIAMPLVMAFVVLPTASRSVSTCAPALSMSPLISAMPCALSLTGPNVSIETMTPAVVSRPQPASATANSATAMDPLPSRNAPKTASAMRMRGVDSGLQAERDAGQDDGCRAGDRACWPRP